MDINATFVGQQQKKEVNRPHFAVSKGGKSTMSNLQTLCERCNRGKGIDYHLTNRPMETIKE